MRSLDVLATVVNCKGSVWHSVLPFCFLNCLILYGVEVVQISFPASGHNLMTLIISFLVVSKVSWSYDRYMKARHALAQALTSLRELNQTSLGYTLNMNGEARAWREEVNSKSIALMDCTLEVLQSPETSTYLARNACLDNTPKEDPMLHVQALRLHLYKRSIVAIEPQLSLIERIRLVDMLNSFVAAYRVLLALASTPIPFPLVQMARTFLFLWTFSIPFIVRGVAEDIVIAMMFVFFLTYGFIGLEMVASKLMFPFGDGSHDLGLSGMREATARGIETDIMLVGESVDFLKVEAVRSGRIDNPQVDATLYVTNPTETGAAGICVGDADDDAGSTMYVPMV